MPSACAATRSAPSAVEAAAPVLTTATNPYVDADEAERVVGAPAFRAAGEVAERRALIHVGTDERGGARGFDGR